MTSKPVVGLQLWTLRELCERDFWGALEKIAQVGFRWIEPYTYYGIDAHELGRVLKDLGLGVVSSHVDLDSLENNLNRVMDQHDQLGCHTLICPWLEEDRRQGKDAFEKVGRSLQKIGAKLRQKGFTLLYHNHDFEFTMASDPDGLQRILTEAGSDNLGAQLDVYWASHTGRDPVEYMKGLGARLQSVHLKDRAAEGGFAPVGHGVIDMAAVIATGREMGVKSFIVEQDEHKLPPFESLKMSLEFLQGQGL